MIFPHGLFLRWRAMPSVMVQKNRYAAFSGYLPMFTQLIDV